MKKIITIGIMLLYIMGAAGCADNNTDEAQSISQTKMEAPYDVNEQIHSYLNMTVSELIELTGEDIDKDGSEMVFEHNIFFPCIYLKDSPFYIICRSYDVNYTPLYVAFYEEDVEAYLATLELNNNMTFDEIMAVMGSVPICETEREGDKRFKIEIPVGDLKYVFCADNQEGDNFSFYIGVEEDNTHEVVFGNLESDINMYHVMEREVKDNAILFLCELDDEENDTVLKQTIQIKVQAYTDERISDYETARAYFDEVLEEYDFKYYQDIKDFNGVTEIYVAIQEEMMYCIFNMQNESYLITTDATNLLSLLHGYGLNDCLQRECIVEHIECSEDREIEVYKDIQYPEMCARYCFGKEREYWADYQILSMDDRSYQMRFSLYVQSNMIQTLEWNSYFVKYPEFIDVNKDGYVDMKVVMDSAPAYDIVELYIWDGEKNCFEKVICEEQLAHIESKEGNLWNWTRSGEGYILQIFSWENNVLVKESEEVIMPDANEVISPGMKLETVLEKLEQSGIIIERHNMQYYASGIELEKMGIARLEWDPNETITYVNTVVDTGKVDELQDYELVIKEEQFVYCDEERNVNIVIHYPLIEAGNHQETTEQMNSSIEKTVQEILTAEEVSGLDNISLDIEYSLKSVESERFSILWEGVVTTPDGEYEVRKALTYNMLKNSIVLEIEENGWTNEQLVSELSWQLELEETVAAKILSEKQYEFYVTPLHLVVIYEDKETQEYRTASMFR